MIKIDLDNLYDSLPPATFAAIFCDKMREEDDIQNMVSSRQAIAIAKILIATCFRKETSDLIPDDYIRSAVITTAPEDQEIAKDIAVDILFPRLNDPKIKKNKNPCICYECCFKWGSKKAWVYT